jgi:NAD(P)-dependent dehydrogenase (short-subunit alcohol dehydrogenase family)
MTPKRPHARPILVTGASGAVGSIGRNLTEMLLAKGHKVRALVRREDERAEALRQLGAEVMHGDLTDLIAMHRAIEGCARLRLTRGRKIERRGMHRPALCRCLRRCIGNRSSTTRYKRRLSDARLTPGSKSGSQSVVGTSGAVSRSVREGNVFG